MNQKELEGLSEKIASRLAGAGGRAWVPGPVRPEPPGRPTPGALPPWAGSAQIGRASCRERVYGTV